MARRLLALIGFTLLLVPALPFAQSNSNIMRIEGVRRELMQLPYYGVFDFLSFRYDRGTVTLNGYAYRGSLKHDAEQAVKRAPGVDIVKNNIEELPASSGDDQLRWNAYYKIYRDPFLSHYAPGGGLLWGHRHPFNGPFALGDMEPAGDYPIHIIVKNGRITLMGVVENESDKTVAGARAREVPGAFGVQNDLIVEGAEARGTSGRKK